MLTFYFIFIISICVSLVCCLIYGIYRLVFLNPDKAPHSQEKQLTLVDPTTTTQALRNFILDYLDDSYHSPLVEINGNTRLFSDLQIDSLDFNTILNDIGRVTNTEPTFSELEKRYGPNPSVNELVSYVRSLMIKKLNNI